MAKIDPRIITQKQQSKVTKEDSELIYKVEVVKCEEEDL